MPISRRSVVLAGSGSLLLSGCSTDVLPGHRHHGSTDPDLRTVRLAAGQILQVQTALADTVRRHPGLGPRLAPIRTLHRTHLDALLSALPHGRHSIKVVTTPTSVPPTSARALADLGQAESALVDALAGSAQQADSGNLARLLASMAAAVGQQLANWPGGSP